MDASVISRVLKGERSFTFAELQKFGAIVGLTGFERELLDDAYWEDLADRFGCDYLHKYFSAKEVVENAANDFKMIQRLKSQDEPLLTEELVDLTLEKLDKKIARTWDQATKDQLLEIKGKVLFQKSYCVNMNREPRVASTINAALAREILQIGRYLKSAQITSYGYSSLGVDVCYLKHDYLRESEYLYQCVNTFTIETEGGEFTTMSPLRDLLINLALMGEKSKFKIIKQRIMQIMPKLDANTGLKCQMWEGMAKAEFTLGNIDLGQKYLDEAWATNRVMEKNNDRNFLWRKAQIIRTQLMVNRKNRFGGVNGLKLSAREISYELKKRGYKRYQHNIDELLATA